MTQPIQYANTLCIRLQSDLCPGSGEGYSSGIDSDVCHNDKGIPIIPGRRLKGCLRQAARDIHVDPSIVTLLFGSPGSSESGLLKVWDAVLDVPEGLYVPSDPSDALDTFTYTRAQTKVNPATGTVADGTLRYTRVVKHYIPAPKEDNGYKEASFHAQLELRESPASNEQIHSTMGRIARALKNVGLNRNRGLGVVSCHLQTEGMWSTINSGKDVESLTHRCTFTEAYGHSTRSMVAVSYAVRLEGPVMLPQQNAGRSHDFIPGTSVQGFFASRLVPMLKDGFNDVFMGDKVRFSPLYPLKDNNRCLPAPPFIVKLKGGKHDGCHWNKLFITSKNDGQANESQSTWKPSSSEGVLELEEGTSFKSSKSGFVGSDWIPQGVKKTIAYHHSTGETTGDEGTLYMQECLMEGQEFAGYVECEPQLAPTLLEALDSGVIYFGRSKSAQYGRCKLIPCNQDLSGRENGQPQTLQAGAPYALILESDVALLDTDRATYTTDAKLLCDALSKATSIDLKPSSLLLDATNLSRRTTGGYNAKWNQKRPQSQVLTCGSAISFVADSSPTVPTVFTVGERQNEGFGRIRLVRIDQATTPSLKDQQSRPDKSNGSSITEKCRAAVLKYAKDSENILSKLTSSFVGRLSLMVRQSTDLDDLNMRIAGIANEQRREAAAILCGGVANTLHHELGATDDWGLTQQCLALLFRYAKYNGKLASQESDAQ